MPRALKSKLSFAQGREWVLILAPAVVLVLAAFLFTLRFVDPGPPRSVTMATGGPQGAYFGFGKRYSEVLARSGVRLEVRSTAGSLENIKLLKDPAAKVSIALLQGGIANSETAPDVMSVGRVFHEPLWVFYRGETVTRLPELKGRRIAIGPEGSGTRALALDLLKASGIDAGTATLLPLTGQPAADALVAGQVDAVFLALAPQAPIVQTLLRTRDVKLMSFAQADAMTKVFPYLARLTVPQGVFSMVDNVPDRDVTLIGPQAALVVRNDLHPAIIALIAEAAQEVHGKGGLFSKAGDFPTMSDPEFEMDADALRFYKSGPTFWKRILPFWMANFMERLVVLLVPVLTVLFPLMKAVPWLYKWRIRQRLLHWYRRLKEIEERIGDLPKGAPSAALDAELAEVDEAVSQLPVPIQFAEQFYNLRTHLDLVRERLKTKVAAA